MITNNVYNDDGFGENYKFIIYAILYAEYLNEEFHYTKMSNIEHNYDSDIEFVTKKEKLINIINNYPIAKEHIQYKRPDRFELLHFFENNIDFCIKSKSLKYLKNIFKEVNETKFDSSFCNIAIHIRKMNIQDISKSNLQVPGTDVPIDLYNTIIRQLKNIYNNCKIHIYSQTENNLELSKEKSSFDFEDDSIVLHLNETVEKTFIDFVYADVLVVAPSSFSYSAGLLSDGVIYYIESCHKALPNWNMVEHYVSTHDRYRFFIGAQKIKIYYDTKTGQFYKDINGIRLYINIYDYL
jgi:hypothetical protein